MAQFNEAWVEHQRRRMLRSDAHRWMRPDAHRWARPDARRSLPADHTDRSVSESFEYDSDLSRLIAHADDPEHDWRIVAAIRRAQCAIAAANVELALDRLADVWRKANFNPNQPRVPAGNPDGGQWTSESGEEPGSTILAVGPPGIGHNQGPPLEPPEIPRQRPATAQEVNAFLKAAAQWIAKAGRASVAVSAFVAAYEALSWLDTDRPYIEAYQDPPKTLEELHLAVSDPKRGYDTHHIVEQTPARDAEFPEEWIESAENKVRIPTLKHWEVNAWYQTKNKNFGNLSPRKYLQDKSWSERVRVGLDALIDVGVLKP